MADKSLKDALAPFSHVEAPTLAGRVASEIRTAIFRGQLAPGARIVEYALAKKMQVAQGTVREAINELQREGFLVKFVNKETLVRRLTAPDLRKLFLVRVELEPLAMLLVHPNASAANVEPLRDQVEKMRRAARKSDYALFLQLDLGFHQQLWRLADNEFLERALEPLSVALVGYVLAGVEAPLAGSYLAIAEDHAEILDVLEEQTAEAARDYMKSKLAHWHTLQMERIQAAQVDGETVAGR